ncbi:MAG: type II secretion system protein [Sulfurospirillaceae bacterium]|nr:type II secretion system protein [Sulfurospirillaceae bacterium]MDD2825822.1 type II secretion system protein [Sulfurospirillaceae bacterium]
MQRGFTLIELIVTIVILGVLSVGTFISLEHLYLRSAKSKALSELAYESQMIVDQIASLMYDRIPSSAIGYNPTTPLFQSIYQVDTNFTILEWIGVASEAHKMGAYSGFVDMNASDGATKRLSSVGISALALNTMMTNKFGSGSLANMGLVFAGSFDDGAIYYSNEFNTTFGWHGNSASKILTFTIPMDGNITISAVKPNEIYEKYYLVDSAYAVARGGNINKLATCITDLNTTISDNTFFLFYAYHPWQGETFCADSGVGGNSAGKVTILSKNVGGFEAGVIDGTLYFTVSMNKVIRGSDNNVSISKQKAVY